jgi:hypothetical protein
MKAGFQIAECSLAYAKVMLKKQKAALYEIKIPK